MMYWRDVIKEAHRISNLRLFKTTWCSAKSWEGDVTKIWWAAFRSSLNINTLPILKLIVCGMEVDLQWVTLLVSQPSDFLPVNFPFLGCNLSVDDGVLDCNT